MKICKKILGLDHIIAAKVSYVMTINKTNENYGNTTATKKSDDKIKINDYGVSRTFEDKSFDYTVYFDIYKNGTKIYTLTREHFLKEKDSWMDYVLLIKKMSYL